MGPWDTCCLARQLHIYVLRWNELEIPVLEEPGMAGCYLLVLRRPADLFLRHWRA